ncbi:MAG: hypothetical protein S0880_24345 [Actinomycetota bacterium]|nr:hypothetical protein [Actinomycetota bacterium]
MTGDAPSSADQQTTSACPNCGAPLPASLVDRRVSRDVERAGCGRCALQLIRRGAGDWSGIRG